MSYLKVFHISIENGFKVSFDFLLNFSSLTRHFTEAKISQKENISLEFSKPLEIQTIALIISRILKFFCFAIDKTVTIKSLTAMYSNDEQKQYVEVYYRSLPYSEKPANIDTYLMLFHFSMVSSDFEKLVNNWLKYFDFLEPTFNLYFFTIQNPINLESRFLFLAQALETFHRRTCNETLLNKEAFEDFLTILRKAVEGENKIYKEIIDNKINYAYELSLRQRLKRMIEPFNDLFGTKKDRNTFINQFVNTRNYLTHYDKNSENLACKDEDLLNLGRKSEALLQLHLLKCIEFPENLFEEVFNRRISGKIRHSQRLL